MSPFSFRRRPRLLGTFTVFLPIVYGEPKRSSANHVNSAENWLPIFGLFGFGLLGEQLVDGCLDAGVRLRAGQPENRLDPGVLGVGVAKKECRGSGDTGLLGLRHIAANLRFLSPAADTLFKLLQIETEGFGVGGPGFQRLLVGEEPVVHFPVFPLFSRAVTHLRRLDGQLVDRLEGEVHEHVFELSGCDVFLIDLRGRLTDVPGAVRSLVI